MSEFAKLSYFKMMEKAQEHYEDLSHAEAERKDEPVVASIVVSQEEVERWYNELNDIVRRFGVSTSTASHSDRGAQKRAQKASVSGGYGGGMAEIHDRLTDLRDEMYRHAR